MPDSNKIGPIQVATMRGRPVPPAQGLDVLARPGRDYEYYRKIGLRGQAAVITTTQVLSTPAEATAAIAANRALVGTSQTIIDDDGTAHPNCMITDGLTEARAAIHEGAVKYLLRTQWTIVQGRETPT